ncbi:MAG: AEC family transporter [Defluviitaleaceae bacterium]|nr:AEC family transporter [Defluviitaleaceae bacterium]
MEASIIATQNPILATFINSLTALTICIVVGYISRKVNILTDEVNAGMSGLLVKVTMPFLVFNSMIQPFSYDLLIDSLATIAIMAIVYLFGYILGMVLARILGASDGEKQVWQFSLMFANVGYMGFPIIYAIYGSIGLLYTTMANITFNILAFSIGIYLFKRKSSENVKINWKSIILNPVLAASYIGFIFFIAGWQLPYAVGNGVSLVGGMTIPLSMILVGSILAKSRFITLFTDLKVIPVIAVRLLVIPLATFFVLRHFLHNIVMFEVIVILAAMPAASLTVIFAEQFRGDTAAASKIVALSSFLCLLSIPLVSLLLYAN